MSEGDYTVWCLLGRKAGDNTQVLALANELGLGFEEKRILARPWELLTHLGLRVTLAGIDRGASSDLAPPWPDLVISAGRRNEPVARWIQRQSGGRTRLVHMGRPWAPLAAWDLIVTTPQYFLPEAPNILHNTLPLHRVTAAQAEEAAGHWQQRLQELPRPWIAVLVGGDSGRYVFTPDKGARLGSLANALAESSGGSLLLTDSPRTPAAAADALETQLDVPAFSYRFSRGGDNPYQGLLALADAFVVTGESMSMLGEAAETGRPLYIFDPGDGDTPWWHLPHAWRYKPLSHRFAMRFGPRRMRRDIGRIQWALVDSGRAEWLEEASIDAAAQRLQLQRDGGDAAAAQTGSGAAELRRSAEAVRRLLKSR
ncbi:MAG: mitochondrial fission ELM1 family protein [Halioglobus sp.]|nr:mitochondrial fission ELM1 family protein [Halioglobus sp.]